MGNTHNYQDGADLTEALCAKLDHKGKVAILVGNIYQDDAAMMLELLYGVVS